MQGVVKLKDMASGQEEEVPQAELVQAVQQRVAALPAGGVLQSEREQSRQPQTLQQ